MAKKTKATSAEEKLRALYDLQLIDSRIDRLRVVRGELPLEVEDLEDEIAGLESRLERLKAEADGITDRIKDMFITGGFNVYPAEVENLLYGSGKFAQVAVVGVPDERMGEVCMAFVVPAAGEEVTPESVISWSRENMANYKAPRRVEVVSELPANASGKVLKFELRKKAQALPGG